MDAQAYLRIIGYAFAPLSQALLGAGARTKNSRVTFLRLIHSTKKVRESVHTHLHIDCAGEHHHQVSIERARYRSNDPGSSTFSPPREVPAQPDSPPPSRPTLANHFSLIQASRSWVSHETPATSAPLPAPSVPTTVRDIPKARMS